MLFFIESWIDKIKLAKLNTRTVIRLKTHDRLTSGRGHDLYIILAIDLFKLVIIMPISITNNISNCRRARRGVYARRGEMKLPRVYPRRACLGVKGIIIRHTGHTSTRLPIVIRTRAFLRLLSYTRREELARARMFSFTQRRRACVECYARLITLS